MSETLPDVREAPERPLPDSEARQEALQTIAEDFSEQIGGPEPTPQPTVGEALAAASEAEEPPAEEPQESAPTEPEPRALAVEEYDELNAWLDDPDPEDISDEELRAAAPADAPEDEFGFEGGEEDPRVLEERRRRIAAERRAQHYEQLRAQDARKEWKAEAVRVFPLSEHILDSIDATSKKAYMRAARDEQRRIKPYLDRYVERASGTITAEAEQIHADTRAEAARQYGKPTTGPGGAPIEAGEKSAKLAAAREQTGRGSPLRGLFKTMMEVGE